MTTVAWKDGIMAADGEGFLGTIKCDSKKLYQIPGGGAAGLIGAEGGGCFHHAVSALAGGGAAGLIGAEGACLSVLDWLLRLADAYPGGPTEFLSMPAGGAGQPEFPKLEEQHMPEVLIGGNGRAVLFERLPVPIPVTDKFLAFGSGAGVAVGAMAHGASAVEAVQISAEHASSTGRGVVCVDCRGPSLLMNFIKGRWPYLTKDTQTKYCPCPL